MVPRLSVLVPVYEQWDLVPALLQRLAAQLLPQDQFEIILADNGSHDFHGPETLPPNVRIVSCAQPGSYAARNAAAASASGQWFAFTDADCLPEPGWLAALTSAGDAADSRTILVGAVAVRPARNPPNAYEIYDMIKGIPQDRYASRGYGATANLAVSAALFRELGGFDAARLSGGDAEFCRRAGAAGAKVRYVPDASVEHPARDNWEAIATKSRRVLGGQIVAGSFGRRAAFLLRAVSPPVIAWARFARAPYPIRYRATAMWLQLRLWGTEIAEAARLLAGAGAERR
jgi:glycosyltransferase involved in cell wall biosynthesis